MNCTVTQLQEVPEEIRTGWGLAMERLKIDGLKDTQPDDIITATLKSSRYRDLTPIDRAAMITLLLAIEGRGRETDIRTVVALVASSILSPGDRLRLEAEEAAIELGIDPSIFHSAGEDAVSRWREEARTRIAAIRDLREMDSPAIRAAEQDLGNRDQLQTLNRQELRSVLLRVTEATATARSKFRFLWVESNLPFALFLSDNNLPPGERFREKCADLDAVRSVRNPAAFRFAATQAYLAAISAFGKDVTGGHALTVTFAHPIVANAAAPGGSASLQFPAQALIENLSYTSSIFDVDDPVVRINVEDVFWSFLRTEKGSDAPFQPERNRQEIGAGNTSEMPVYKTRA